jgi:mevalonate kinase
MKKWKKIGIISLLMVAIILTVFLYFKFSIKKEVTLLSDTIEEKVSKILEISTVKYNYTNVVTYKDNKKANGLNLPFTNKSFILKYSGYIKAGVDLNGVETKVLNPKTVKMTLDNPSVLDNVIVNEDVYIYDERDSVFNKLSFNDLNDVLIEEKKKMEKETIEKGLLKEAEKNTKELLTSLLESMGFENIEIVFR